MVTPCAHIVTERGHVGVRNRVGLDLLLLQLVIERTARGIIGCGGLRCFGGIPQRARGNGSRPPGFGVHEQQFFFNSDSAHAPSLSGRSGG